MKQLVRRQDRSVANSHHQQAGVSSTFNQISVWLHTVTIRMFLDSWFFSKALLLCLMTRIKEKQIIIFLLRDVATSWRRHLPHVVWRPAATPPRVTPWPLAPTGPTLQTAPP